MVHDRDDVHGEDEIRERDAATMRIPEAVGYRTDRRRLPFFVRFQQEARFLEVLDIIFICPPRFKDASPGAGRFL